MSDENPTPIRGRSTDASRRLRTIAIVVVVAVMGLLLSVRGIANVVTDYLWFDARGYGSIWRGELFTKIMLGVIFTVVFAVICWVNLWLADRLAPAYREPSPEEEAVARFRELLDGRWGLARLGVVAMFALSIGAGAASQWQNWLLFRNGGDFGQVDAQFGRDIGFYVFRLPFMTWVVNWLFTAILVTLVLTVAMHYLSGGIRVQSMTERVTPQVKAHVSLLLAAMALVRAGTYWLDRYALAYSTDGKFSGLSYTDVQARLPVLSLLILIALLSVVLFLANIGRRGWGLPAVAVGLWALVSIVMSGIYPLVVQRFSVNPDETTKEAEYVARNIEATREAFGLGPQQIVERTFSYQESLSPADLQGNADNLASAPLLDPDVSTKTFELQQVERAFFRFDPRQIDVGRYEVDGTVTPVLIGARELNPGGIPESGWESEALSFTHGNGVAVAPANAVEDSLPIFLIGDVPIDNQLQSEVPIDQPRIYYGETMSGYAIVGTDREEVDSIEGGTRIPYTYTGEGGVEAGGWLRRALFSLRFQSIDPLISNFVRDDSRFVWHRNVSDRVSKVAPFLRLDHNPYPTVVDGRVLWVIDAYTTTANYPYSQLRSDDGLASNSGLRSANFNYVRNSVKAVVDAYDGTITLYVVDETDPIIEAWGKAFPDVLVSRDDMPPDLLDNLRYPEDIFTVQTNMWGKYHVDTTETADLLEGSDEWSIAQDPGGVTGALSTTTTSADGTQSFSTEQRVSPYYSVMRLPEENRQEFVIFRSFVPFSRDDAVKEMQAFMIGVSEVGDENYGRLVSYEIDNATGDNEAPGPALVASQITSQDRISERISLLDAKDEGSSVEFGDLVVIPVENSLVYVRPLYVIASGTQQPNLEWVIVSHADSVVMCHGLADSIDALFGVRVDGVAGSDEGECIGDVLSAGSRSAIDAAANPRSDAGDPLVIGDGPARVEALSLLEQAEQALAIGNLGRYQQLVDAARDVLAGEIEDEALASVDDDTEADDTEADS